MSFLSPFVVGVLAPLVALPLVLHLLNKGFPRHFRFPSIRLIQETLAHRSRLSRWRHWILLLLRTAFLLLLLTAFARPVLKRFGSDPNAQGRRHVFIVLDHSLSMEHRGDGPTSRERATHEARQLLESLAPQDAMNILLVDQRPSACFTEFSKDSWEAKRFLERVKPGLGRADVNLANSMAARLLSQEAGAKEVYYVSDFQRKNWADVDFTILPPGTRLFFVNVGASRRNNRAILEARLADAPVLAGDTTLVEATVGNFSDQSFAGRITVMLDRRSSFDQEVAVGPWSETKVKIPVLAGGPGVHLCELKLPPDALDYDNQFCLSFTVQEKEEVLLVTDGPDSPQGGAWFLKTALNPFENGAGSLLPRLIPSSELSPDRLAGVKKVFFTQLNRLSPVACAATAKFLFQGGGLVYFLDGPADPENLAGLERAIGPNSIPLQLSKKHTATNVVSGAQQVVRGDFKSPYLKLFRGTARQNLALMEFYDYYQAGATGAEGILLLYGDDSPAMAVTHHGTGTMLLLNFSAGELSSNLARQRVFPAWIQELVKAVSAEEAPPTAYTIGETLHTEVWRTELRDFDFQSPSGAPVTVKSQPLGERYSVSFTPEHLGFYTLGSPRPLYAFGINTSPEESDLRPIDMQALPREFAAGRDARFVAGSEDYEELAKGRPVFHWFVLAGMAFLVTESGFQLFLRRKAK